MKPSILSSIAFVVIIVLLTVTRPVSANSYWFQVGVYMQPDCPRCDVGATGASVEIRTRVPQPNPQADTSFWVGLNLPNDAFIQVGYLSCPSCNGGYPVSFWEYFPPKTASQGGGRFIGSLQDEVGPNGTWYTYSLQSNGNMWYTYVNGVLQGSIDLGISNSGGNAPYAVAEVEQVLTTHIILGPAEFRNLAYRDTNKVWHNASSGVAYIGLGAGSGALPSGVNNPYGLQVLGVNDWLAGSGLSQPENYQLLWAGSTVMPEFPITGVPVLVLCLTLISILVRKRSNGQLRLKREKMPC